MVYCATTAMEFFALDQTNVFFIFSFFSINCRGQSRLPCRDNFFGDAFATEKVVLGIEDDSPPYSLVANDELRERGRNSSEMIKNLLPIVELKAGVKVPLRRCTQL
jgi:hypothetical protein